MKTLCKAGLLLAVLSVVGSSYVMAAGEKQKNPFEGIQWTKENAINYQKKDTVLNKSFTKDTQIIAEADVNEADMNSYYGPIRVGTDGIVNIDMNKHALSLQALKGLQFKKYPTGIVITSGRVTIDHTHGVDIYAEGLGYRQGILVQGRQTKYDSQGYFGRGQSGLVINNTDSADDVVRIRIGNDHKPNESWKQEHEPLVRVKGEVEGYATLDIKGRVDFENTEDADRTTDLEPHKMGGKVISVSKGEVSVGSGRLVTVAPIAIYAGFSEVYTGNIKDSARAIVRVNSSLPWLDESNGISKAAPIYNSDVTIDGMVWVEANSVGAVSLVTPKSKLNGAFMGNEKYSSNYLTLKNHAFWHNYRNEVSSAMEHYQEYSGVTHSHLKTLDAGDTPSQYGWIEQTDKTPITIENFNGHVRVLYRYNEEDPIFQNKGNIEIARAMKGSSIILFTDKYDELQKPEVQKSRIFSLLARKLIYHAAAQKTASGTSEQMAAVAKEKLYKDGSDPKTYLIAGVGIAEGLTKPEEIIVCGKIDFDEFGVGVYNEKNPESFVDALGKAFKGDKGTNLKDILEYNKEKKDNVIPEKKDNVIPEKKDNVMPEKKDDNKREAAVVESGKTAIFSTILTWQVQNNDLQKRLGDLRLAKEESGVWAKYQGGAVELDTKDTKNNPVKWEEKYNGIQAGYDKVVGEWTIGGAFGYMKSDDTYISGTGKGTTVNGAIYGSQIKADGTYIDIIAKAGQVKNDYDVHTEGYNSVPVKDGKFGDRVKGTYKANAVLLSLEYGKRMEQANGFYFEPSAELTMSHIGAYDETVTSLDGKVPMKVHTDAVNSLIGKLGVAAGQKTENMSFYGKLSLAHEFGGEIKGRFEANNYPVVTNIKMEDTWLDLEIGGSFKMSESSYIYGTFTKNFGAKINNKWRLDAGIRFAF